MIRRGLFRLESAAQGPTLTRYHLEAELASCHVLAPSYRETDWARIIDIYDALLRLGPSPVVALNRAVALAEVQGAQPALEALEDLGQHASLRGYYPYHACLGTLLDRVGRGSEARHHFRQALELTVSQPVRRFLLGKLRP